MPADTLSRRAISSWSRRSKKSCCVIFCCFASASLSGSVSRTLPSFSLLSAVTSSVGMSWLMSAPRVRRRCSVPCCLLVLLDGPGVLGPEESRCRVDDSVGGLLRGDDGRLLQHSLEAVDV